MWRREDVKISEKNNPVKIKMKVINDIKKTSRKIDGSTKLIEDSQDNQMKLSQPRKLKMGRLISVINQLQDVFNMVGSANLQLPQIVVVGCQSAGKSSVIESLVGNNFLPRGSGIVTRRPLILQLINCPLDDTEHRRSDDGTDDHDEWGEFLHLKHKKFFDFDEIREEIENETDRVAGKNKNIVDEPINLKIFSDTVVNLTLVDLPGITKVPVGDQPLDIEIQIRNLIMKYIENPNSIILAVSAANTDLATSEALKFAKDCDPDGSRTLAVLTKLDLMDEGTDAKDVLAGNVIPVKLGIIGVVNRSQQAINDNRGSEEQVKVEEEFLARKYPMQAQKNGTKYLGTTLSHLLINHIKKCLPDLRKRITDQQLEFQSIMNALGKKVEDENEFMVNLVIRFSTAYAKTIDGTSVDDTCGSTMLYEIIHRDFDRSLRLVDPVVASSGQILKEIVGGSGPRPTLFDIPSFDTQFEKIVRLNIQMLKSPSIECVELVRKEMQRVVQHCGKEISQELKRFPKLQQKIVETVSDMLRERMVETMKKVEELIESELAYINKKHRSFDKFEILKKILQPSQPVMPVIGKNLSNEEIKKILKDLVESYFDIVLENFKDIVPKAIMNFLVNEVKKNVQGRLLRKIYEAGGAPSFMRESKQVGKNRNETAEMLKALSKAEGIIGKISEIDIDEWEDDE